MKKKITNTSDKVTTGNLNDRPSSVSATKPDFLTDINKGNFKLRKTQPSDKVITGNLNDRPLSVSATKPSFLDDINKGNFKLRRTKLTGDSPNSKPSSDPLTKALQDRYEAMGYNDDDDADVEDNADWDD